MLQYRPRPRTEKFSLNHCTVPQHSLQIATTSSGQFMAVQGNSCDHAMCMIQRMHTTRATIVIWRSIPTSQDVIVGIDMIASWPPGRPQGTCLHPASAMCHGQHHPHHHGTPSTPSWNIINTMMETRFTGGARINKERRPEINSAAGEASIQLLQLIPSCHGGHFSDANFA